MRRGRSSDPLILVCAFLGYVSIIVLVTHLLVYMTPPFTPEQALARTVLLLPGQLLWAAICLPAIHAVPACSLRTVAVFLNVVGYIVLSLATIGAIMWYKRRDRDLRG